MCWTREARSQNSWVLCSLGAVGPSGLAQGVQVSLCAFAPCQSAPTARGPGRKVTLGSPGGCSAGSPSPAPLWRATFIPNYDISLMGAGATPGKGADLLPAGGGSAW